MKSNQLDHLLAHHNILYMPLLLKYLATNLCSMSKGLINFLPDIYREGIMQGLLKMGMMYQRKCQ